MANCRWNSGCIVYWGVVMCSIILLIVLHFQGHYVIPTDEYLSCEYLLKTNFSIIIIFTIIAIAFTKSNAKEEFMPVVIVTMAVGLLLLSIYTMVLLESVTFPKVDKAVEIVRKRYASDSRVLAFVQMRHKCCGVKGYLDWQDILVDYEPENPINKLPDNDNETEQITPLVPSSCCKFIDHCGMHMRSQLVNSERRSHGNNSVVDLFDMDFNASVNHQVYTKGCYKHLKVHSHNVYESMQAYACIAFVFVSLVTLVFSYYWWRSRVQSYQPEGWPPPPMDVQTVIYDSQKGIIVAFINPFMEAITGLDTETESVETIVSTDQ